MGVVPLMHMHHSSLDRQRLLRLTGRNFCVPFTRPSEAAVCHEIGQSVMLDNGAFTMWRQGKPVDWNKYYDWAEPWLDYPTTWAVIPDVIDGTEDENDELVAQWPFSKLDGAPVWHMHESLERLDRLVSEWALVCLGSSGAFSRVATPAWHNRMADAMDVACDQRGRARTRLHMLRGLELSKGPYPFWSADSSMIAQKHGRRNNRKKEAEDVVRIADEIDGRQPSPLWRRPLPQLSLEAT